MLTCRGCQKEFVPKRKGQEYHNRNCFLQSTIRLVVCPECGTEFKKKRTGQVCCTPQCANKFRAKKLTKGTLRQCAYLRCTKQRHIMPSRISENNFCGRKHEIAFMQTDEYRQKAREQRHTLEEKEKIRQANLQRDYSKVFTAETRQKLSESAKKYLLNPEVKERTRVINSNRLKGGILSEETKAKIRLHAKYGEDNIMWKGDFASYYAMHAWVVRHKGRASKCDDKGIGNVLCKGRFEWSNVDHIYRRVLDDYTERCTRHHRMYDKRSGLTRPKGLAARFFKPAGNIQIRTFTVDAIVREQVASPISKIKSYEQMD